MRSCLRLRGLLAVLVGVASFALGGIESASATTVYAPVFDANIWGNLNPGGGGNVAAANLVNYLTVVSNPRPWLVTTQEVCEPQYLTMRDYLDDYGYTAVRTITKEVGGACGHYGNAMFLVGAQIGGKYEYTYTNQASPPVAEVRKLTCQAMTTYLGAFVGCNTHLLPADSVARLQETEADNVVRFFYQSYRRWVGGDFNWDDEDYPGVHDFYGDYWSNDPAERNTISASNPTKQYDFTWGAKNFFSSVRTAPDPLCNPTYSDHCWVSSRFQFTV